MNAQVLNEIYSAKDERRKRLCQLPIDEKVAIIERLRDMAIALRVARQEFSKKYVTATTPTRTICVPVQTTAVPYFGAFAPIVLTFPSGIAANDYEFQNLDAAA